MTLTLGEFREATAYVRGNCEVLFGGEPVDIVWCNDDVVSLDNSECPLDPCNSFVLFEEEGVMP
jgi:hypothetical protein